MANGGDDKGQDGSDGDADTRARTHLASERTFLAWLRTGVTLIALGLAAAQFLAREIIPGVPITRSLAIALVIGGVAIALGGARRYHVSYERIEAGRFVAATRSVIFATALIVLVGLLAIAFILLLRR